MVTVIVVVVMVAVVVVVIAVPLSFPGSVAQITLSFWTQVRANLRESPCPSGSKGGPLTGNLLAPAWQSALTVVVVAVVVVVVVVVPWAVTLNQMENQQNRELILLFCSAQGGEYFRSSF